jgi:hypothetical protein
VSEKQKGAEAWLQGIFPDVFDPDFGPMRNRSSRWFEHADEPKEGRFDSEADAIHAKG